MSALSWQRPWGSYQSVDNGDRHHVKPIEVKPGARLSLQADVALGSTGTFTPQATVQSLRRRYPATD